METVIASLYANIAGDHRYSDRLVVEYITDADAVRVRVLVTSAVGGMDGPGGAYPERQDFEASVPASDVKAVVRLVRNVVANGRWCFRSYGKPSKRLAWRGGGRGISAAVASQALAGLRPQNG